MTAASPCYTCGRHPASGRGYQRRCADCLEVDEISSAMRRIIRMVGYPIPAPLAERLGDDTTSMLRKIIEELATWDGLEECRAALNEPPTAYWARRAR